MLICIAPLIRQRVSKCIAIVTNLYHITIDIIIIISLQFHQLSIHYFSCHAAMEAYAVATIRNLPDPYPILKLLCPHFRYTMAINTAARATLIDDGGIIDYLFAIGDPGVVESCFQALQGPMDK